MQQLYVITVLGTMHNNYFYFVDDKQIFLNSYNLFCL